MLLSSPSFVMLGDDEARLSGPAFLLRSSDSLGRSLALDPLSEWGFATAPNALEILVHLLMWVLNTSTLCARPNGDLSFSLPANSICSSKRALYERRLALESLTRGHSRRVSAQCQGCRLLSEACPLL